MREYLKNTAKQAFYGIAILTAAFMTAMLPVTDIPVYADAGKAIVLVNNGAASNIENPASGAGSRSKVYFGNYYQDTETDKDPVQWRVLSNADKKLFLLADKILEHKKYNEQNKSITWENCTLRKWLNGDNDTYADDNFINETFSNKEQSAVATTTVVNNDNTYYAPDPSTPGGNDTSDKLFLLSADEATNTGYGFPADHAAETDHRKALPTQHVMISGFHPYSSTGTGSWWLRTPGGRANAAIFVTSFGEVRVDGERVNSTDYGVRPALNIDLESVLLTSAAEGGKVSGTTGPDALNAVDNTTAVTDWKLTVTDTDRSGFKAGRTDRKFLVPGNTLTISYSGAQTGENEYVSAIITNAAGSVMYYGHIAQCSTANGEASITIPNNNDITENCKLYVFQEQCNGDKKTDLSSDKIDITKFPKDDPEADDFVVTLPSDTVYDGNPKTATASVVSGVNGMGKITVKYYDGNGQELTGAPVQAGTYKVKLDVEEGDYYNAAAGITKDEWTFTINEPDPKPEPEPEKTYTVTVTTDPAKCGTAKASVKSGVTGKKVTITADPKAGYKFSKWKVISGGVKLANANKAKTTFKIKNANVKVKAIFEKIYKEPQPKIEPVGDDGIILAWWEVKEAKGYDIYMSRCNHGGKEITPKKIKTIKGNKAHQWTVTGLEPNRSYKAYIRAYTTGKNGKKKYISKSPLMHVYTAGGTDTYTDAKSVKLDTSDGKIKKGNKLSLKVKGTYKIKASVTKTDKKKKLMPPSHVPTLRYRSSDPGIATVSKSGKITAKKPGKCNIYVYAHNGVNKTIKLTVK